MKNNEVIDTLNTLIETSRDGDKGFTTCAEDAKDASLRAYFTICATRCRESVRTLEELVKSNGGSTGRMRTRRRCGVARVPPSAGAGTADRRTGGGATTAQRRTRESRPCPFHARRKAAARGLTNQQSYRAFA